MAREEGSDGSSSKHTSDSDEDIAFGESYIEVELSIKQLPGTTTLEITTDSHNPGSPSALSPSHAERKRSFQQQKVVKAYELAAISAAEKRNPTFLV